MQSRTRAHQRGRLVAVVFALTGGELCLVSVAVAVAVSVAVSVSNEEKNV